MNSHKAAISTVRATIKTLSAEKPALRKEMFGLKYDTEGKHRPETGQDRCDLRRRYADNTQCELRANYIAYGLLRGRPYKVLEATCHEEPNARWVATIIQRAFGDDAEAKFTWSDARLMSLIVEGKDLEPEPYVPPVPKIVEKPKGFFASVLGRMLG